MAKQNAAKNPSQSLPTAEVGRAAAEQLARPGDDSAEKSPPLVPQTDDDVPPGEAELLSKMLETGGKVERAPLSKIIDLGATRRLATSMPIDTEEQRIAVYCAVELEDEKAHFNLKKVYDVVHWCQFDYVKINQETGELENKRRTVFVLADGRSVGSGSDTVADSFGRLLRLIKADPPWNPPRKLKVVQMPGANGYPYDVVDPRCD